MMMTTSKTLVTMIGKNLNGLRMRLVALTRMSMVMMTSTTRIKDNIDDNDNDDDDNKDSPV